MKSLIIATMLMLSVNVGAQPSVDTLSVAAPADTAQTTKENKLVIDLDFLTRGELRKGGLSNEEGADDQATFVIARTLLGIGYQRPGLIAHATAQHSGVWGSNETNSFNIYEAWVDLNTKNGFFAKVGRQSLSYDDQRIFGSDDWAMTAMSHDALKLGYEGHGHKLHIIGAFNQNIANIDGGTYFTGGLQPYKAMETVWYHYDVKKIPLGISLLFTNIGMQSDKEHKDTCTRTPAPSNSSSSVPTSTTTRRSSPPRQPSTIRPARKNTASPSMPGWRAERSPTSTTTPSPSTAATTTSVVIRTSPCPPRDRWACHSIRR